MAFARRTPSWASHSQKLRIYLEEQICHELRLAAGDEAREQVGIIIGPEESESRGGRDREAQVWNGHDGGTMAG